MAKRRKSPADGGINNGAAGDAGAPSNYAVGYGRPPKARQFKKGTSGNPAGRTKGVLNSKTLLEKVLSQRVSIVLNGEQIEVTMIEGVLTRIGAEALKGNLKAGMYLFDKCHEQFSGQESSDDSLPSEDVALLARYAKRVQRDGQGGDRDAHGHYPEVGSDTKKGGMEDDDDDEGGGDGQS